MAIKSKLLLNENMMTFSDWKAGKRQNHVFNLSDVSNLLQTFQYESTIWIWCTLSKMIDFGIYGIVKMMMMTMVVNIKENIQNRKAYRA